MSARDDEPMTTAGPTTRRWPPRVQGEWTVDDLLDTPDDGQRYEVLDGLLLVTPAPRPRHQRALLRLATRLQTVCPADHEVFVAPLDWQPDRRTSLQPDILVVRQDQVGERGVGGTPTLVVEILSPSTARIDRTAKLTRYADAGIPQYWIVDTEVPAITVFDLLDGTYRVTATALGSDDLAVTDPLAVTVSPSSMVGRGL